VAETLARMPAPPTDLVAHHFRLASDARALAWLVRSAETAHTGRAWPDTRERYLAAIDLAGAGAPTPEERTRLLVRLGWVERHIDLPGALVILDDGVRLAGAGPDGALALAARYARGVAATAAGRTPTGVNDLRAVVDVLAGGDDGERRWLDATERLGPDAAELAAPAATLALALATAGTHAEAAQLADHVARTTTAASSRTWADVELARAEAAAASGHPGAAARAYREAARHAVDAGDGAGAVEAMLRGLHHVALPYAADRPAAARRLAARAEATLARMRPAGGGVPPRFACLPLLVLAGEWQEAAELASLGTGRGSVIAELGWLALAGIAAARGDTARARAVIHEALPDGVETEPGEAPWLLATRALGLGAELALDAPDADSALEWIEAHERWVQATGLAPGTAEGHLLWARHHHAVGELEPALRQARQACASAGRPRQPLALQAAHRLLGELHTATGALDGALHHLGHALQLADSCQDAHGRALTQVALAEAHVADGSAGARAASALAAEASAAGAAMGARPLVARARRLGLDPPRLPGSLSNLTTREVQVLRLITDGRSNADAAGRLGISRRTVEHHLEAIYGKLGVASRTAAVREAVAHGLT
jgi:DNA-binding NarL/FixJ family response regulator